MVVPADGLSAEAIARFAAAESRLYPMAMVDAAGYERATTLVGRVLAELRVSCGDIRSVLQRREQLIARLPGIAAEEGLSTSGVPAGVVIDAASAVRCRELHAAGAAADRRARVAAARAAGEEWLVDQADPSAVLAGSYRKVEWHVPTGAALISSIEAGGRGAAATYTVELIPGQGPGATVPALRRVYPDRASWAAAIQQLRGHLSSGR